MFSQCYIRLGFVSSCYLGFRSDIADTNLEAIYIYYIIIDLFNTTGNSANRLCAN